MTTPAGISVLGVTGSIGQSTLDVIGRHPGRFRLVAAAARSDVDGMAAVCGAHQPEVIAMSDPAAARLLEQRLGRPVLAGAQGLEAVATHQAASQVMAAIVGGAGLAPTLAAARAGKRVLLANKEALVMAGALLMDAVAESGAELLPIDSEHNAIFQCLPAGTRCGQRPEGVDSIVLTASGGPFLRTPREQLGGMTPEQAVAHPNWSMGRKISVDSATMMNKGLECIEAAWLFDLPGEHVEVIMHPQSVVHSMVRLADGSVLAQLGQPDMRTPIAYSMAWPDRVDAGVERLDFAALSRLDFLPADRAQFPCLALAEQALAAGGAAPVALNAANEVAVQAFLDGALGFMQIPALIEAALERSWHAASCLDSITALDSEIRQVCAGMIPALRGHSLHA